MEAKEILAKPATTSQIRGWSVSAASCQSGNNHEHFAPLVETVEFGVVSHPLWRPPG